MTTKQDIRNEGFRRGQCVASWTDLPEIGARVPRGIDWVGYGVVTEENLADVWELFAFEAGARNRISKEYDDLARLKPYDVWQVFEDGITAGIRAYWRKHHATKGVCHVEVRSR